MGLSPEKGEIVRLYQNGVNSSRQGNYDEAYEWWEKAAAKNHAGAIARLANRYEDGDGVKQDYARALQLYKKADALGDWHVRCKIAEMYYEGRGVKKDVSEAAKWWRIKDYAKLKSGAEKGNVADQISLGDMYIKETEYTSEAKSSCIGSVFKEARKWYRRAAEKGNPEAQFKLAQNTRWSSIGPDEKESLIWLEKAAEQGHTDAQIHLAGRYWRGERGANQDHEKAIYWFKKAAIHGSVGSQKALGDVYWNHGESSAYGEAYYWYSIAASNGETFKGLKNPITRIEPLLSSEELESLKRRISEAIQSKNY